jgi:hypothetical protein
LSHGEKGSEAVSLDGVAYSWRNIRDLPSAYAGLHYRNQYGPDCVTNLGEFMAGMIGKKVTRGRPKDYESALQRANLSLLTTDIENQHYTLQPFSRWFEYWDSGFQDPPILPGEQQSTYGERICKNKPEVNGLRNNFPQREQW